MSSTKKSQAGFTLLEVLVWMAIAAIAISFVTLSVGSGSRGDQLKADAEKLAGMVQLAVEEAVLTSRPMGLKFVQEYGERDMETTYEWSYFELGEWTPIREHSYFYPGRVANGTEMELRLEGRAAELGTALPSKAQGQYNNGNAKNDDTTGGNKAQSAGGGRKITYKPDIFFLHSGEITPAFEIDLQLEAITEQFQIAGNAVGQIELRRRNSNSAEWR